MKTKLLLFALYIVCSTSLFAYDFKVDNMYFNKTSPNTVEITYAGSFTDPSSMKNSYSGEIDIPKTVFFNDTIYQVTKIGQAAFWDCINVTKITIPNTVVTISNSSFLGSGISSIDIPASVDTIGNQAFTNCLSLNEVTIHNKDLFISGFNPFEYTPYYDSQPDGLFYIGKNAVKYKGKVPAYTTIEFKEGTKNICQSCFFTSPGIVDVIFPNTLETIQSFAFAKCQGLTELSFPNNIKTIEWHSFMECNYITSVTFPDSVLSVTGFDDCLGLKEVTINKSATKIESFAFQSADSLTFVEIPENVKTINTFAFAFSGLENVIIGKSVEYIANAFNLCPLKSVTCNATTPPACHINSFFRVDTNIPLYVPKESMESYDTAFVWKDFNVKWASRNVINKYGCESYMYEGTEITETTSFYDTIVMSDRHDSIVIVNVIIGQPYEVDTAVSIPYGSYYVFGDQKLSKAGTYKEHFTSVAGCDSLVYLTLVVADNNAPVFTISQTEYTIAEDTPNKTKVAIITATDPDGAYPTYSIKGGSDVFEIDSYKGNLIVKDASLLNSKTTPEYQLVLEASDGTDVSKLLITIAVTSSATGVNETLTGEDIEMIYSITEKTVHIEGAYENGTVQIFSIMGTIVSQYSFNDNITIDVSDFANGCYVISVISGTKQLSEKFIIK